MHWYVGFADPVPAPGSEPTLFEWAGGLPALTRMSRLLYEKHIPAEALLAPVFADMPPDQPQRLAGWLARALGGPPATTQAGDLRQAVGFPSGDVGDQQQARWVALATRAADEAGLPADAGFRAAFSSCIEWVSRAALAQSQPGTDGPAGPAPRWDWGQGGPPATQPASDEADIGAEPLPRADQAVSGAGQQRLDLLVTGCIVKEQQDLLASYVVAPPSRLGFQAVRDLLRGNPGSHQQAGKCIRRVDRPMAGSASVQWKEELTVWEAGR